MKYVLLMFVAAVAVLAQDPIPHRPPRGFQPGTIPSNCNAPVEFKAFIDLTCPDCKQAWPTLKQVAYHYNPPGKSLVDFEALIFPLPYHRAAFPAAQATYILRNVGSTKVYTWFDAIFCRQSKYYNDAILLKNQSQVEEMLAEDIFDSTGVSEDVILSRFKDSDPSRKDAIVMWKYACTRTVSGTPTVFINGIRVDFALTWTLDDWRQVIDPLLTPEATEYNMPKTCPAGQATCKYLPGKIECCFKGEACIPNVGCRC